MGKGSTQFQHLVQTEVPTKLLEGWLEIWAKHYNVVSTLSVKLRPHGASSELLELAVWDEFNNKMSDVVFATIQDRRGLNILSVRDQNNYNQAFRMKRFMTLNQIFLIHRYKINSVHYVTPNEDNKRQTEGMKKLGIFRQVSKEIGGIIVASVNSDGVAELLKSDKVALKKLIAKE